MIRRLNDAFFLTACALMACGWATAGLAEEPAKPGDKTEAKVAAKSEAGKAARVPDAADKPVVTVHSIEAGGKRISYAAETGMLPLLKDDGTAKASMFYVAYTLEGGDASRPIMFCFNGGPGASAVWLHLGGLGPRRACVNPNATLPPPPYELVDNAHTLPPHTDLVFIDPVATGYSRPAKDEKAEQFFGQDPDIAAMAEFIVLYTTRHRRWRSPKYLCSESYGVFRAAGIAEHLQDRHGMFLNGLLLVSGLVDFGTIRSGASNDLPYKVLTGVGQWKFDQNTYVSTAGDLARAMSKNPHLRVLVMTGNCDLAVPPDSVRYSVDHLEIAAEVRANVSYADYASGHMMYLNLPDLEKLARDVAAFLGHATM